MKLFDPRMPPKKEAIMQLTGHTGRVRSVLMSQDSRSVSGGNILLRELSVFMNDALGLDGILGWNRKTLVTFGATHFFLLVHTFQWPCLVPSLPRPNSFYILGRNQERMGMESIRWTGGRFFSRHCSRELPRREISCKRRGLSVGRNTLL